MAAAGKEDWISDLCLASLLIREFHGTLNLVAQPRCYKVMDSSNTTLVSIADCERPTTGARTGQNPSLHP